MNKYRIFVRKHIFKDGSIVRIMSDGKGFELYEEQSKKGNPWEYGFTWKSPVCSQTLDDAIRLDEAGLWPLNK